MNKGTEVGKEEDKAVIDAEEAEDMDFEAEGVHLEERFWRAINSISVLLAKNIVLGPIN